MKTMKKNTFQSMALPALLTMALTLVLAGCEPSGQTDDSTEDQARVDQSMGDEQALGQVAEFDGFTIRANVSPTEQLPEAMARQYGIEAGPSLYLVNVVVLEHRPEGQPVPVPVNLSAHYESPAGQVTDIDMREIEANDRVSYVGTLDTSAQRVFQFVIEAQPDGADQPLKMDFEVQLPELNAD